MSSFEPESIVGEYQVIRMIGAGGFGGVYLVRRIGDGEIFAMKAEKEGDSSGSLDYEMDLLETLQNSKRVARVYEWGRNKRRNYMVMGLYGPSLSKIRRTISEKKFSISTTLRMAYYMLLCISDVHRNGIIHRDIKPSNFLINKDPENPLVIIDFGMSKHFQNPNTLRHYNDRGRVGFHGTTMYASINAHQKNDLSRRDDIISWLYSVVELFKGVLPWTNARTDDDFVFEKQNMSPERLFRGLPNCFLDIWNYITQIDFHESPECQYMIELVQADILRNNISLSDPFDWEDSDPVIIQELSKNVPLLRGSVITDRFPAVRKYNKVLRDMRKNESACCLLL